LVVDIGGDLLGYVEEGVGEAVLFMHSLGASKVIWAEQVRRFRTRFRCIAADAPGHGESTHRRPIDGDLIVDAHAALLDALGVSHAHVVGVSMGGCWAQQMWRRHPSRVLSLTLCDTFASMADLETPVRMRAQALENVDMRTFGREYAASVFKASPSDAAREALAEAVGSCSKEAYLETARACYRSNTEDVLATITVPTLVITGELDDRIDPSHARHLAETIPGARLVTIEGAGHLPQLDNPAAFDAELEAFLNSIAAVR